MYASVNRSAFLASGLEEMTVRQKSKIVVFWHTLLTNSSFVLVFERAGIGFVHKQTTKLKIRGRWPTETAMIQVFSDAIEIRLCDEIIWKLNRG